MAFRSNALLLIPFLLCDLHSAVPPSPLQLRTEDLEMGGLISCVHWVHYFFFCACSGCKMQFGHFSCWKRLLKVYPNSMHRAGVTAQLSQSRGVEQNAVLWWKKNSIFLCVWIVIIMLKDKECCCWFSMETNFFLKLHNKKKHCSNF